MNPQLTIDSFLKPQGKNKVETPRSVDDPRRELVSGAVLAAVLLIGGGGWALAARLDAAVTAPGTVRVAGARQQLQAPAAGIVSAVRVANGQAVRAGQVLVEFTATEASAQERSLAARVFGLQAELARINAELAGKSRVPLPAEFAALTGPDRVLADAALASEQSQLDSERALEASEAAVLRDRGHQVRQQIAGYGQRLQSAQRQTALNQEELSAYQQLLAKGLATKARVLALQREGASLDGEAGATVAEMARLRTQAGEAQLQFTQLRSERLARAADRLRTAQTELASVLPQWEAARAQVGRLVLRAPVAGVVTATQLPIPGTVAPQGARLLEIVPDAKALSVEVKVALAEGGELVRGQPAQVRLSGAAGRLLPTMAGTVERVSADSVEDERTGQAFYTASVRVSSSEVKRVAKLGELAGGIRAGTPVEVIVPLKQRSALEYLLGPLVARTSGSFSQR